MSPGVLLLDADETLGDTARFQAEHKAQLQHDFGAASVVQSWRPQDDGKRLHGIADPRGSVQRVHTGRHNRPALWLLAASLLDASCAATLFL